MFLVDISFINMKKITPELTEKHRAYLATEYQKNNLLFGGRKEPRTGGLLISAHSDKQSLCDMLDKDPFIQSGAVSYSITAFEPVMAAKAYQHLVN